MTRFLFWLSGFMRVRFVLIDGASYLDRFNVWSLIGDRAGRSHWVNVVLHYFHQPDPEQGLHNHPWRWALVIPLTAGYIEERLQHLDGQEGLVTQVKRRRPFLPYLIGPRDFHAIRTLCGAGAWSLFIHSRRVRGWGFIEGNPFTEHVEFSQPFPKSPGEEFPPNAPRANDTRV